MKHFLSRSRGWQQHATHGWPKGGRGHVGHEIEEPVRCVSALQALGGGDTLLDVCLTVQKYRQRYR